MGISLFWRYEKCLMVLLNISFLMVACSFLVIQFHSSEPLVFSKRVALISIISDACEGFDKLDDHKAKCLYLKRNPRCVSEGYIDYLYLSYCSFGRHPILGYTLLSLWLVVLFYLLGNTASEYFCTSLDSLSKLLKLSPVMAGVTLLSLGNGAPDVFASLVAFMGNGTGGIGLSTVIGGASFVSCVVVGTISILLHRRHIRVMMSDFMRDVFFYLMVLVLLTAILINGAINLWGAIGFLSIYIVYVVIVYMTRSPWLNDSVADISERDDLVTPILRQGTQQDELDCEEGGVKCDRKTEIQSCAWFSKWSKFCNLFFLVLKFPLYLPRRLTIPVVSEDKWSKPFAVVSVSLAPLFLLVIWRPHTYLTFFTNMVEYGVALLIGIVLGILAIFTTESSNPPRKCLLPWLAGGFVMSVTWSYITATELVGLLISFGYMLNVNPDMLGLTVLAWGNSIGDLITNVTMALHGGEEGAQISISACYAGPIFNTLFGLGLSLVGSCWYQYPSPVLILNDPYLLESLGFLAIGLLWALLVLPRRGMRLDAVLGGGLLLVYIVSLSLRLIQTIGAFQLGPSASCP